MDPEKRIKNLTFAELFLNFIIRIAVIAIIVVVIFYRVIVHDRFTWFELLLILFITVIAISDRFSYIKIPGVIEMKKITEEIGKNVKEILKVQQSQKQYVNVYNQGATSTTNSEKPDYIKEESIPIIQKTLPEE